MSSINLTHSEWDALLNDPLVCESLEVDALNGVNVGYNTQCTEVYIDIFIQTSSLIHDLYPQVVELCNEDNHDGDDSDLSDLPPLLFNDGPDASASSDGLPIYGPLDYWNGTAELNYIIWHIFYMDFIQFPTHTFSDTELNSYICLGQALFEEQYPGRPVPGVFSFAWFLLILIVISSISAQLHNSTGFVSTCRTDEV
jgi:hypothetical protein